MEEAPINAGWEAVIYDVPDDPGKVLKLLIDAGFLQGRLALDILRQRFKAALTRPQSRDDG